MGVKLCWVGPLNLIDVAGLARHKNVLGLAVPLEISDLNAGVQVQQADGHTFAKLEVTISFEEENLTSARSSNESHLVGSVKREVDWAIVSFHDHSDFYV